MFGGGVNGRFTGNVRTGELDAEKTTISALRHEIVAASSFSRAHRMTSTRHAEEDLSTRNDYLLQCDRFRGDSTKFYSSGIGLIYFC